MKQTEHWKHVRHLWSEFMYEEAADRGYRFDVAAAKRKTFDKEKAFYAIWWGMEWSESNPPEGA